MAHSSVCMCVRMRIGECKRLTGGWKGKENGAGTDVVQELVMKLIIYIYSFSRHVYPKQLSIV